MHLTRDDILFIMDRIGREVIVPASGRFIFEVVTKRPPPGYSKDPVVGPLQAKLYNMLRAMS